MTGNDGGDGGIGIIGNTPLSSPLHNHIVLQNYFLGERHGILFKAQTWNSLTIHSSSKATKNESSCPDEIPLQMLPMGIWGPENMKIENIWWRIFDFSHFLGKKLKKIWKKIFNFFFFFTKICFSELEKAYVQLFVLKFFFV